MKRGVTVVIGDTHFPFHHKPTLKKILGHIKKHHEKISHVIQVGDLYDLYCFNRYGRREIMTAYDELENARNEAEKMWSSVRSIDPKIKCIQLLGNHDERLSKWITAKAPELEPLIDKLSLWSFDGVKTMPDQRTELELSGVIYIHGDKRAGAHMLDFMKPCVHGHDHKLYVMTRRFGDNVIWEASAGMVADPDCEALSYGMRKKYHNMHLGFLEIENGCPKIIHC